MNYLFRKIGLVAASLFARRVISGEWKISLQIHLPSLWTNPKGTPMPPKWNFFTHQEVEGLNDEFIALLDRARGIAKTPFDITSGRRTIAENERIPTASSNSSHLSGDAVDLACSGSPERFQIVKALLEVGFTRIGIYSAHLHVDCDKSKPQNVMWYIEGI
jgi:zinc D-Ala-D-Ala carboxypeptidase